MPRVLHHGAFDVLHFAVLLVMIKLFGAYVCLRLDYDTR